jgi:hypothetical protein
MRGHGQQAKATAHGSLRLLRSARSPAPLRPFVGPLRRVNPSACSIHLGQVYSVDAAFFAGESLKRDTKRDKLASNPVRARRQSSRGHRDTTGIRAPECKQGGGGGRSLAGWRSADESSHLNFFSANAPLPLCARLPELCLTCPVCLALSVFLCLHARLHCSCVIAFPVQVRPVHESRQAVIQARTEVSQVSSRHSSTDRSEPSAKPSIKH